MHQQPSMLHMILCVPNRLSVFYSHPASLWLPMEVIPQRVLCYCLSSTWVEFQCTFLQAVTVGCFHQPTICVNDDTSNSENHSVCVLVSWRHSAVTTRGRRLRCVIYLLKFFQWDCLLHTRNRSKGPIFFSQKLSQYSSDSWISVQFLENSMTNSKFCQTACLAKYFRVDPTRPLHGLLSWPLS